MSSQNKFFTILSIDFLCPLPEFYFPFYSLLWIGVVMSINTALSVFLLRGMRH